jgi:hypothetical protein
MRKNIIEIILLVLIVGVLAIDIVQSNQINVIQNKLDKPTDMKSEEDKYYDWLAENIIMCESEGKMVWGDLDLEYKAFGVAQFQERTFNWLSKLSGKKLDYDNQEHQKELLRWALENNYGYLWTCYNKVKQEYARQ